MLLFKSKKNIFFSKKTGKNPDIVKKINYQDKSIINIKFFNFRNSKIFLINLVFALTGYSEDKNIILELPVLITGELSA